ncbi:unnamed protein product [Caenorhabditis brenneri]
MPLPILKLPFLALKVIIACGEDVELLKMSLCSRRASRTVNACKKKLSIFKVDWEKLKSFNDSEKFQSLLLATDNVSDLEWELSNKKSNFSVIVSEELALNFWVLSHVGFKLNIVCLSKIDQYKGCKKTLSVDGTSIPFIFSNGQPYGFFKERVDGLKFFVKYFETHYRLTHCWWEFKDSVPDMKPLVSYLNSLPRKSENEVFVESVAIGSDANISQTEYKYLLETVTHELNGSMKTSKRFKLTKPFATDNLVLDEAHWFTLKHLLEPKWVFVQVEGCKFTNKQLKVFMQKWWAGELVNVESVDLQMKEELDADIILGFPRPNEDPSGVKVRDRRNKIMLTVNIKTIQAINGDLARISTDPDNGFTFKKLVF